MIKLVKFLLSYFILSNSAKTYNEQCNYLDEPEELIRRSKPGDIGTMKCVYKISYGYHHQINECHLINIYLQDLKKV